MKKFKVAVARFPGGGVERWESVGWLITTIPKIRDDPRVSAVADVTSAPSTPITMLRNRAVSEALEQEADYLLMIDSDMAPDTPYAGSRPFWDAAWEFMMDRRTRERNCRDALDRSVSPAGTTLGDPVHEAWRDSAITKDFPPATIAAPYCGPPPNECCYVFHWATWQTDSPDPNFRLEMIPREHAALKSGIQEQSALPTGLILYDMRVFNILPPPWFRYEYKDVAETELASTEDVYQTRNASLLKLPQFCAWDSWAGHIKTKVVGKPIIMTRDRMVVLGAVREEDVPEEHPVISTQLVGRARRADEASLKNDDRRI